MLSAHLPIHIAAQLLFAALHSWVGAKNSFVELQENGWVPVVA